MEHSTMPTAETAVPAAEIETVRRFRHRLLADRCRPT
jgi:hypothetical protein